MDRKRGYYLSPSVFNIKVMIQTGAANINAARLLDAERSEAHTI